MTSDNASPGATTVAELASDRPSPVLAALGADAASSWATSSMWVSINGAPAGDWDGPSGRVSPVPNLDLGSGH